MKNNRHNRLAWKSTFLNPVGGTLLGKIFLDSLAQVINLAKNPSHISYWLKTKELYPRDKGRSRLLEFSSTACTASWLKLLLTVGIYIAVSLFFNQLYPAVQYRFFCYHEQKNLMRQTLQTH